MSKMAARAAMSDADPAGEDYPALRVKSRNENASLRGP
jgi:hypothetical protein